MPVFIQLNKNYEEIIVINFEQCMVYLNRSDLECLHKIKGDFYGGR